MDVKKCGLENLCLSQRLNYFTVYIYGPELYSLHLRTRLLNVSGIKMTYLAISGKKLHSPDPGSN